MNETMNIKATAPAEEIAALAEMISLFMGLDKPAADRALTYLRDRFVDNRRHDGPFEMHLTIGTSPANQKSTP